MDMIFDFSHCDTMEKKEGMRYLDCSQIPGTRLYCSGEAGERLQEMIAEGGIDGIHFLDSGDYHYLSKFTTDQIREPFCLVLIDHHTDIQESMMEGLLSCGSWAWEVLIHNPFLEKVLLIGPEEAALEELRIRLSQTCRLSQMSQECQTPQVPEKSQKPQILQMSRPMQNDGKDRTSEFFQEKVMMVSQEEVLSGSAGEKLLEFAVSTELPLYLSIDKDALGTEWAATNWDQGELTPEIVKEILRLLAKNRRVLGADVCGEYPEEGNFAEFLRARNVNSSLNRDLYQFLKTIL